MIQALAILLGFQLAGEVLSRLALSFAPGPVIGFALLIAALALWPPLMARLRDAATGLLAHLSLFFVPAGVGVVTQIDRIGADAAALIAALVLSTLAAILVGALTFRLVARLTGGPDD